MNRKMFTNAQVLAFTAPKCGECRSSLRVKEWVPGPGSGRPNAWSVELSCWQPRCAWKDRTVTIEANGTITAV